MSIWTGEICYYQHGTHRSSPDFKGLQTFIKSGLMSVSLENCLPSGSVIMKLNSEWNTIVCVFFTDSANFAELTLQHLIKMRKLTEHTRGQEFCSGWTLPRSDEREAVLSCLSLVQRNQNFNPFITCEDFCGHPVQFFWSGINWWQMYDAVYWRGKWGWIFLAFSCASSAFFFT